AIGQTRRSVIAFEPSRRDALVDITRAGHGALVSVGRVGVHAIGHHGPGVRTVTVGRRQEMVVSSRGIITVGPELLGRRWDNQCQSANRTAGPNHSTTMHGLPSGWKIGDNHLQ